MNRLGDTASPYLRQHADNPVHWWSWTPEALSEARHTDKPILLSIGYAACHWCHVMAHESFEDPETAAVMNALYINIKVDREERPDIDHIYMSALHALGERGGWPLTMFLTPDAQPFWGGTYFPKTPRYGQAAFTTVLTSVERAYRTKPDQVGQNARAILNHLTQAHARSGRPPVTNADMDDLAARLVTHMDPVNGGMQGAPKFPNPQILEFLWRAADRAQVPQYREAVLRSLDRMSQGGIFDHLGGGFARYSVDERWLVPHFEKMLYDNAQLLELLALAWHHTRSELFRARARETVGWLRREMTNADGAFCASLDADSEGDEGKFYVWTEAELVAALGADDAAVFAAAYDVSADGNWTDPHSGNAVNVLNRLTSRSGQDEARLADLRARLFEHRSNRVRPSLDDKVLADWNGLMIAALVRAGLLMGEPAWLDIAASAYTAVMQTKATQTADGLSLVHAQRGAVQVPTGFALDYAAMARAALALHETGKADRAYLAEATALLETLFARHLDPASGLLAMNAADSADIILRLAPTQDDAIPNAHAVALDAIVRLSALTGSPDWSDKVNALFASLADAVHTNSVGHVGVMNALDLHINGAEVVIAGEQAGELEQAALASSYLSRTVIRADAALPDDHVARAQVALAGDGAAFVCRRGACSPPVRDAAALVAALQA